MSCIEQISASSLRLSTGAWSRSLTILNDRDLTGPTRWRRRRRCGPAVEVEPPKRVGWRMVCHFRRPLELWRPFVYGSLFDGDLLFCNICSHLKTVAVVGLGEDWPDEIVDFDLKIVLDDYTEVCLSADGWRQLPRVLRCPSRRCRYFRRCCRLCCPSSCPRE